MIENKEEEITEEQLYLVAADKAILHSENAKKFILRKNFFMVDF